MTSLQTQGSTSVAFFLDRLPRLDASGWAEVRRRAAISAPLWEGQGNELIVQGLLAAVRGTAGLDPETRNRAVKRAGTVTAMLRTRPQVGEESFARFYGSFEKALPLAEVDGSQAFVTGLRRLEAAEWIQVVGDSQREVAADEAATIAAAERILPCLDALDPGDACLAWMALRVLIARSRTRGLKFARAYAPFAAVLPLPDMEPVPSGVQRYATILGELGSAGWAPLADDHRFSTTTWAAFKAVRTAPGPRLAEEAASMVAVMTAPKVLAPARARTAANRAAAGGALLGCAGLLEPSQILEMWEPLEPTIPLQTVAPGTLTSHQRMGEWGEAAAAGG
ncbi:MAG: hypothetical protein ACYDAC_06975 [Candidatus Dormibacteria bacterium]